MASERGAAKDIGAMDAEEDGLEWGVGSRIGVGGISTLYPPFGAALRGVSCNPLAITN